ncbi:MAG TPA: hypothetical protein VFT19_11800 [Solirubrobacterales bacterium]|nr:hypothetical protein [Solirubrobacterales bacterium]
MDDEPRDRAAAFFEPPERFAEGLVFVFVWAMVSSWLVDGASNARLCIESSSQFPDIANNETLRAAP